MPEELAEAIEILVEKLKGDESVPLSLLSTDAAPDTVGGFFEATAALYRAKPWMVVPSDAFVTSVTKERSRRTKSSTGWICPRGPTGTRP